MHTRRNLLIRSATALFSSRLAWAVPRQSLQWANGPHRLKGVNVFQPFGWGIPTGSPAKYSSAPYTNGGTWSAVMPASRLTLLKSTGFDVYRLAIDPGPLLAAESMSDLATLIGQVTRAIVNILEAGLLVIADVHVLDHHPVPGWTNVDLTDGISGSKFNRLVTVEQRLAASIEAIGEPSRVCLELFNEPPYAFKIRGDRWRTQLKYLFNAVRPLAPRTTLVVGGSGFNSIDDKEGLLAIDPKAFDTNTIYSWHGYDPYQLSMQGTPGHYQYIHRLAFPPRQQDRAKAINDLTLAINADRTLSAAEKASKISYFTRQRKSEGTRYIFQHTTRRIIPCQTDQTRDRLG